MCQWALTQRDDDDAVRLITRIEFEFNLNIIIIILCSKFDFIF